MTLTHPPLAPPIFIGGTGRSGTTALARMLGLHSDIHAIRWESQFIVAQDGLFELAALGYPDDAVARFTDKLRDYWYRRVVNEHQPSQYEAGLCTDVTESEIDEAIAYFVARVGAGDAPAVADSINRGLVDLIFDGTTRRASASRWCEKTPRSVLYIEELADLYPGSTFIHIIRDGRDVAASMVARQFWPVAASRHHPSMATFRGEVTFEKAMAYWETVLRLGRRSAITATGIRYIEIRLEDLATDPKGIVAYLLNELGEPMSNRMLRFDLSKSNLGRWATDLSEQQQAYALDHHGEALAAEGYGETPEHSRAPAKPEELGRYVLTHEHTELACAPIPHKWREPEDLAARLAMELGRFPDHDVLAYIDAVAPRGSVIDVGAHVGARALFFAQQTVSRDVVAVEPRGDRRALAGQNLAMNAADDRVNLLADPSDLAPSVGPVAAVIYDARQLSPDDPALESLISDTPPRLFVRGGSQTDEIPSALSTIGYETSSVSLGDTGVVELLPPNSDLLPSVDVITSGILSHDGNPAVDDASTGRQIRGTSALNKDQRSFYLQTPPGFRLPPDTSIIPPDTKRIFIEASAEAPDGFRFALFVVQYSDTARTFTDRVRIVGDTFASVSIDPETTSTRLALRIGGAGSYSLDRLRVHYS